MDVTRRPAGRWIVDFGWDMVREEARSARPPYRHAQEHVYPTRQRNHRESCRERWLNPPEWVERVYEAAPGYPKRPVPRDEAAAKKLKARTLTNLYNARPQWLADAHRALDTAVAAAYGWPGDIGEEEALPALNAGGSAPV